MSCDSTREALEFLAGTAGWDSFTLLRLVSQWIDEQGLAAPLLEHLAGLADEEDDADA